VESLLNTFGFSAWVPVVFVALPLAVAGLIVRRRAQSYVEALTLATRVDGVWRACGDEAVVERDDGTAVLVAYGAGDAVTTGTRVSVLGVMAGDALDPRGGDYRSSPRVTRLVAERISVEAGGFDRAVRRARTRALVGAAMFAAAVAVAAMATMVAVRALE